MKIINNLNNKTVQLIFVILLCFSSIISTFYFALLPGMGITRYYGFKPQVYMISIVILGSCLINVLCIIYMATKSFKRLMCIIKKKEIPGNTCNTCKTVNATHSKSTNSRKNRLKIILTRALLIILCIYMILFNFIIYIFYCIFFNSVEIRIFEILPIAIVILNIYSIVSVYRISVRKLLKQ